jgi:hypothetical protein
VGLDPSVEKANEERERYQDMLQKESKAWLSGV